MDYKDDFLRIKEKTESLWANKELDRAIYGFQIEQGTKWRPGLSESELCRFEEEMGFSFPEPLKAFYRVMNGLDHKQVNIYGESGEPYAYSSSFYSYPEGLERVRERINWIYEANGLTAERVKEENIPRIFPVYRHRFMVIDHPGNPILSMYGDDIIIYADSLVDLFYIDLLNEKRGLKEEYQVKFWLEY